MDRDTSEWIIRPRARKIIEAVLAGHKDTMSLDPEYLNSLKQRSRLGNIRDRIGHHLFLTFGRSGPVRWTEAEDNRQLEFLFIEADPESVALRPKKADRFDILTSNYPTDYENQARAEQYLPLPNQPWPAHLFVVYTEDGNEIDPQIERILVTCEYRKNGENHIDWWFELYRADATGVSFNTGFDQPRLPGFTGRIKPKASPSEGEIPGTIKPTGTDEETPDKSESDREAAGG